MLGNKSEKNISLPLNLKAWSPSVQVFLFS